MKKFIEFIKENSFFLLLVIPFIFICVANKRPYNDIWFLLNNGRYVFEHGIPYIDPFTIHEGLSYVMQQWLSALFFWVLYNFFGHRALLVSIYIISFILMFIFYKLCYVVSNKKNLSIVVTAIVFSLISEYIVLRPQIFSFMFLLLEILFLELYVKKKNTKYLYALPVLSFLLINFHASMWYFQFIFLLPFILNGVKIKKIKLLDKMRLDNYKLKPILITIIFMIIVAFINPYGVDALLYIFKSYGISDINNTIGEMLPMDWSDYRGKVIFAFIILFMLINYLNKKLKLDIRHFLFICGMTLLAFMHNKCYPLFVLIFTYALMYYIRKLDIKFSLDNKYLKSLVKGVSMGLAMFLFGTFIYTIYYSYNMYLFKDEFKLENTIDYIIDNYDKDDVSLYINFNMGGYSEFRGLKSYIDGRAELFFKKFNGKEDIYEEYLDIDRNVNFDFKKFLNKYKFTHIIVYDFSAFSIFLEDNDDYEVVYSEKIGDSDNNVNLLLYVKKDLEVLE